MPATPQSAHDPQYEPSEMPTAYDPAYRFAPALPLISDYPAHWARIDPEHPALSHHGRTITYGRLAAQVEQVAAALHTAGVRHGDRVMVLSTPSPEAFISFLASARLGAIWAGLNPRYTADEITRAISDAEPALVATIPAFEGRDYLTDVSHAVAAAHLTPHLVVIDTGTTSGSAEPSIHDSYQPWHEFLASGEKAAPDGKAHPDDPAVLVYTSGTTGTPKGALLPHSGLIRLAHVEGAAFRIPARPRYLCPAPLNHVGGLADICCTSLAHGGTTIFHDRFDAANVLHDLAAKQINVLFAGPTILSSLIAQPEYQHTDLSTLHTVAWGGAALSAPILAELRRLGCHLATTYGQTEAVSSVSYTDPDASDDVLLTTVGRPDPELDVLLIRPDGTPAPDGEAGEVTLHHPTVMTGYWRRPDVSAQTFTADGRLRTGDIGQLRPDGNLRLVGRVKEMYKSGGENIYPREIEAVLESHPEILVAAVVPKPDPHWGEIGIGYIETTNPTELKPTTLSEWLHTKLANYKVPKHIIPLDSLPRLANQKIDKQQLREWAAANTDTEPKRPHSPR